MAVLCALVVSVCALVDRLDVVRVIAGVPLIVFFPGYLLISGLFAERKAIGEIERLALSFGLSLAIVPLLVLTINYSPLRIDQPTIITVIAIYTLIGAVGVALRRAVVPPDEVYQWSLRPLAGALFSSSRTLTALNGLVALAAIGLAVVVVTNVTARRDQEHFTEFYLLNAEGNANDYPTLLPAAEPTLVTLVVANRENEPVSYRVEVRASDGERLFQTEIRLRDEELWQNLIPLKVSGRDEQKRIEFLLYRDADQTPYRTLYLQVVTG